MARVHFVLIRPKHPGNVGAVARAAANTGVAGVRLVAPGDWRTVDAYRMAWQAEEILENAGEFPSLEAAVADCLLVAGLSGKGDDRVPSLTPREMAAEIAALPDDAPVGVVFGNESTGLTLEERALCGRQVRIPTSPRQPSMNLAQAAVVAGYEIFLADRRNADPSEPSEPPPRRRATFEQAERALASLRDSMLEVGFLSRERPEVRFREWRELFGRAGLTERETRLLLALARRISAAGRRAGAPSDPSGTDPDPTA